MFVILIAGGEASTGALFGVPEVVAGRVMARSFRLGVTKTDPGWVATWLSDPDLQEAWKAGKMEKSRSNASCSKILTAIGLFF